MIEKNTVYFLVYDGMELIDLSGPVSVFSAANDLADRPLYDIHVVSKNGGLIQTSSGVQINSSAIVSSELNESDTLMVVGALEEPIVHAINVPENIDFIKKATQKIKRIASVCSGAFILASAGVLSGKSITTHWKASKRLSSLYQSIEVKPDLLYVVDGKVWTSAGATTGIDMTLAMIEQDHDKDLVGKIARQLVIHAHRPGNQLQFSSLLEMQIKSRHGFEKLMVWIEKNMHKPIRVADLAKHVNMSERTFHRRFVQNFAKTPAKFVEVLRLERARTLLQSGQQVKKVAFEVGFKSESGFRTAFENYFGMTPSLHKNLNTLSDINNKTI